MPNTARTLRPILNPLIFIFFTCAAITALRGQAAALIITNPETGKEIVYKTGQRVKIVTTDGHKIAGRISFDANNTILIKHYQLSIGDIVAIKRHSLLISILGGGLLVYAGAVTFGVGTLIAAFGQPAGTLLYPPAAALIYAGFHPPNISKMHYLGATSSIKIAYL